MQVVGKNAIFTIAINELDYFKYTLPTITRYAEKTGSDLVVLGAGVINFCDLHYEKYYIIELLNKYERVLHLDADIIVTPNAKNLFELYPDKNKVYAYNESGDGVMDRSMFVKSVITEGVDWQKANGRFIYFNAGVVLISNTNKDIFNDFKEVKLDRSMGLSSQTLMNYFVFKNNISFEDIGYQFNRMNLGKEDENKERYKAGFIHYAGDEACMNATKLETIRNDYKHFYK